MSGSHISVIPLIISIASIYLITTLNILYGYAYFFVPSIISISLLILYRSVFRFGIQFVNDLYILIPLIMFDVITFYLLGYINGFGLNTVAVNIQGYILLLLYYIPYYILLELTRYLYLSRSILNRILSMKFLIISMFIAFFEIPVSQLYSFNPMLLINYLILLARNILLSMIAFRLGFIQVFLFRFVPLYFEKLSPILPIIDKNIEYLLLLLIISVQVIILAIYIKHTHVRERKSTRLYNYSLTHKIISRSFLILPSFLLLICFLLFIGIRLFVVSSGSMTPTLNMGDIVVTKPVENVSKGDIIVFMANNKIIVHRIFKIFINNENKRIIITKGDALDKSDPWLLTKEDIIGKVFLTIPLIGIPYVYLISFFGNYLSAALFIISLVVVLNILSINKEVLYN